MRNVKWTAVSFFALAAMGAASMAFAGCTVTSGTPDNTEGGTGTNTDSGTTPTGDSSTPVDGAVNQCPGNTKQTQPFINAACQTALEGECCTELTNCFNIVPAAGGGTDDCNAYSACIPKCRLKLDGTPETDDTKIAACQDDCDLASSKPVIDAYDAIAKCVAAHPNSNTACQ